MAEIEFKDFQKVEMKVGKVLSIERVPKTDKLYKLKVDVGAEAPIQIVTGLVPYYTEEELKDKSIVVVANLKPAAFAGELSQGMLLCADREKDEGKVVIVSPDKEIQPGSSVN